MQSLWIVSLCETLVVYTAVYTQKYGKNLVLSIITSVCKYHLLTLYDIIMTMPQTVVLLQVTWGILGLLICVLAPFSDLLKSFYTVSNMILTNEKFLIAHFVFALFLFFSIFFCPVTITASLDCFCASRFSLD